MPHARTQARPRRRRRRQGGKRHGDTARRTTTTLAAAAALALAPLPAGADEPYQPRLLKPLDLLFAPAGEATLDPEHLRLLRTRRLVDHVHDERLDEVLDAAAAAAVPVVHLVAEDEHLSDIAAAYGMDELDGWRQLFDANPQLDHPDHVTEGDELRIPHRWERLRPRPLPEPTSEGAATMPGGDDASGQAGNAPVAPGTGVWDRLAQCESGGRWNLATGNGYYGGLQFSLRSWRAVGGSGYPHEHDRSTQIAMAERLLDLQGWGAWPACSRKLGLR